MRKLETDVCRIRKNRDSLQQSLDLKIAKEETESRQHQEIRHLMTAQKVSCSRPLIFTGTDSMLRNGSTETFDDCG